MVEYSETPAVPSSIARDRTMSSSAISGYVNIDCMMTSSALTLTVPVTEQPHGQVSRSTATTQKLSSNSSLAMVDEVNCAECGEDISERFYLYALERRWHNFCLKCCVCSKHLETEGSCYVKDGLIYCKEDYFRRYGMQKCARCYDPIQSGEMVMRAQANIYHVKCFTCSVCSSHLRTGDHFGIFDNKIYCRTDFEQLQYDALNTVVALSIDPSSSQCNDRISANISPGSINMISSSCGGSTAPLQTTHCINGLNSTVTVDSNISPSSTHYEDLCFGDYPPPLSHPDFPHNNTLEPQLPVSKPQRQRKRRQHINSVTAGSRGVRGTEETSWQHIGLTMLDTSGVGAADSVSTTGYHTHHTSNALPNPIHSHLQQVKQKRMRTSFKHHQLKVMKQYFTVNHNPDAKDLKQLSQKTGLSKRVLQVWFQNARAKFRRGLGDGPGEGRTDGSLNGDGVGDNSLLNDDDINSNDELSSDAESQDEQHSNTSTRSHTDFICSSGSPLNSFSSSDSAGSLSHPSITITAADDPTVSTATTTALAGTVLSTSPMIVTSSTLISSQ